MAFGRKSVSQSAKRTTPRDTTPEQPSGGDTTPTNPEPANTNETGPSSDPRAQDDTDRLQTIRDRAYYDLYNAVNPADLRQLTNEQAREKIRSAMTSILDSYEETLSADEREMLIEERINDMLGYGPLEPLLQRDDVTDIMVNGPNQVYIEANGKLRQSNVRFNSEKHLIGICKRIAQSVGRQVDESQPMCDARLPDGSRVNIITKPLAIDGTALTIRKFSEDKLTLEDLVNFGSVTPAGSEILQIAAESQCNILVSGGTGSGKTTLLNCLTAFIDDKERIVTCEDAAELQLQQPHVVRLETRPPNMEGQGEIKMRDLVRNCLRMRPDRIIVGEVRGQEAMDLLNAMNTGHDGSMGTVHANWPRDALSRLETMIAMGGFELPTVTVRQIIASSVDVVVQAARLRDGSRRIMSISEITGMEDNVINMHEIYGFKYQGEDASGRIVGEQFPTGITPNFREKARYYKLAQRLDRAIHGEAAA